MTGEWRIGHYERELPTGYLKTVETGQNQIEDENLSLYYEKLRIVVSDPVFSKGRISEIFALNTGRYDDWITDYERKLE